MKVAILDDYQGVAQEFADWSKLNQTCDVKVFREAFEDEANAIENLKEFEALLIMRERTPITKKLIDGCPNLKFIGEVNPKMLPPPPPPPADQRQKGTYINNLAA